MVRIFRSPKSTMISQKATFITYKDKSKKPKLFIKGLGVFSSLDELTKRLKER